VYLGSKLTLKTLLATVLIGLAFVILYETTIQDSNDLTTLREEPDIVTGTWLSFSATAYCKGTTTFSGIRVRRGMAAADPRLLPIGSVVSVKTDTPEYDGIYTILDTGPAIKGRILDIYMWSCYEALDFGRKKIEVNILRLGWSPTVSTPDTVNPLFKQREENFENLQKQNTEQ
jgi:3D (Asp-Asp-Asp) domain-containing protein